MSGGPVTPILSCPIACKTHEKSPTSLRPVLNGIASVKIHFAISK
jgi:hypothetical protein